MTDIDLEPYWQGPWFCPSLICEVFGRTVPLVGRFIDGVLVVRCPMCGAQVEEEVSCSARAS